MAPLSEPLLGSGDGAHPPPWSRAAPAEAGGVDVVAQSREWAGFDGDSEDTAQAPPSPRSRRRPSAPAAETGRARARGGQQADGEGSDADVGAASNEDSLRLTLGGTRWAWCHNGHDRTGHITFHHDGTTSSFTDSRWRVTAADCVTVDDVRFGGEHRLYFNPAATGFWAAPWGQRGFLEGRGFRVPDDAEAPRGSAWAAGGGAGASPGRAAAAAGAERPAPVRSRQERLQRAVVEKRAMPLFAFWALNIASLTVVMMAWHRRGRLLVGLAASPIFITMALTMGMAAGDRALQQVRTQHRRNRAFLKWVAFHVYLVLLSCCYGMQIRRWHRMRNGACDQATFIAELEEYISRRRVTDIPRREMHVALACAICHVPACVIVLMTGGISTAEAVLYVADVANMTACCVVFTVNTDYQMSRRLRGAYAVREELVPFATHVAYRLAEVVSRLLLAVAVCMVYITGWRSVAFLPVVDFAIGLVLFCRVGGAPRWGAPLLALEPLAANVCHFADEHGLAAQAQVLTRALDAVRGAEVLAVGAMLVAVDNRRGGAWASGVLAGLLAVAMLVQVGLRARFAAFRRGEDLYTASRRGCGIDRLREQLLLCSVRDIDRPAPASAHRIGGRTALHIAVADGADPACVGLLLRFRASPTARDAAGETPLLAACARGAWRTVELLLQHGPCDLTLADCRGRTPAEFLRTADTPTLRAAGEQIGFSSDCPTKKSLPGIEGYLSRVFGQPVYDPSSILSTRDSSDNIPLIKYLLLIGLGDRLGTLMAIGEERRARLATLKIDGPLGAGGFGQVLKVSDTQTGQIYALKLQLKEHSLASCFREAVTLRDSCHAFVVRVFQVFHTIGTVDFCGILMELCLCDLNRYILHHAAARGEAAGLPEDKVQRYAACIALALESLHRKRIVFRDLKPENVLITAPASGDLAKLADFGLARPVGEEETPEDDDGGQVAHTTTRARAARAGAADAGGEELTAAVGTLAFMSQEAFQEGLRADAAMATLAARDCYSFGCCLLLMALGARGGRVAHGAGRDVLLPPYCADELGRVLHDAAKERAVDRELLQLVAGLTAESAEERSGLQAVRASPFLQDAIFEMEAVATTIALTGRCPRAAADAAAGARAGARARPAAGAPAGAARGADP